MIMRRKRKQRKRKRARSRNPKLKQNHLTGKAYDQGFDKGYDQGYLKGLYEGGEAIVDSILPPHEILPELSVQQLIQTGLDAHASARHVLMGPEEVSRSVAAALEHRLPFSLVRLGDGELLTLAQDTVMTADQVRREAPFLTYAGIEVPDLEARDQLAASIKRSTIVGIPKNRMPHYQPLAFAAFKAHGIHYRSLSLTDSQINFLLVHSGLLQPLLYDRRLLIVGNKAEELSRFLQARGFRIAGTLSPVRGFRDVERTFSQIRAHDFDIALISAGVPAVLLVERTANELGKVALDFGHLADSLVSGEMVFT